MKVNSFSRVQLLATPWTAADKTPLSMGFFRQEYWSGCHCLLCYWPHIPSIFVCLRKCLFNLYFWRIILWYKIQAFFFFSQHFKNFTLLYPCLHDFWIDVKYNSSLFPFIDELFFLGLLQDCFTSLISAVSIWHALVQIFFWYGSFLVLSETPLSIVWCLILICGNSPSLLLQIFLLFLSPFLLLVFSLCM